MMFSARLKRAQFLVCSGNVVFGSVVSVLLSDVGISGTGYSQQPWSTMESLFWISVHTHEVTCRVGESGHSEGTMRSR